MFLQAGLNNTLRRIPWFVDLSPAQIDCLASIATVRELGTGDLLFNEGDREDYLYILLEGQVMLEVEVPTRGQVPRTRDRAPPRRSPRARHANQ